MGCGGDKDEWKTAPWDTWQPRVLVGPEGRRMVCMRWSACDGLHAIREGLHDCNKPSAMPEAVSHESSREL